MLNKKDAAKYLGISTRALEYHVKQGNIGIPQRMKGVTGDIAMFDEGELRRLKAKIDERRAPRPAVERDVPLTEESESTAMLRASTSGLSQPAMRELLERVLLTALGWQSEQNQGKQKRELTITELSAKPLLTRKEVERFTGLSRDVISEAINTGKLKAKVIGRGYKVKRSDLDSYVKKL